MHMAIPVNLAEIIDDALATVRNHPEHRLGAKQRRTVYESFGPRNDPTANRARGWLAVLTAQHVLPIGEQVFPDEDIPRRLVEMAEGVLEGAIDPQVAHRREIVEGVDIQDWGYPEEAPWNVFLAGKTGERALAETLGQDLLALGLVWVDIDTPDESGIPMEEWPDEKLAEDYGDTASAAAVAFACDPHSPAIKCDPDRFLDFWEWWLTEAIPTAWEKASTSDNVDST